MTTTEIAPKATAPQPGVYFNMPAADYFAIDAVSKSTLWRLRESPAHVNWPTEQTAAMRFGTAFETAMLEPDRFAAEWAIAGQCSGITGKAARCSRNGAVRIGGAWFCGQHAGDEPADTITITEGEADTITRMVASVKAHAVASQIIAGVKKIQPALVWQDEKTGLLCRGRLDAWGAFEGFSTHIDLKTTADASYRRFQTQAAELGYAVQMAHYRDGCRILAPGPQQFRRALIIAVESSLDYGATHRVEVYEHDEGALEQGLAERDRLMRRYAECKASGVWPGRVADINILTLPLWAQTELE